MNNGSRLRFATTLWLLGMLGVLVLTLTVVPQMLRAQVLPVPLWMVIAASLLQSAVLLALAVWAGTALAPAVGLGAPTLQALLAQQPVLPSLRRQLPAGVVAGLLCGIALYALGPLAPAQLTALQNQIQVPLSARLLYGGLTEEVLLRWGLMSTLLWLAWRLIQGRQGAPKALAAWLAIAVSSLLFAAGHLPAAAAMLGSLPAQVVAFVMLGNTVFGLVFGWLFWRYGLEAAMLAHALAHALAFVLALS